MKRQIRLLIITTIVAFSMVGFSSVAYASYDIGVDGFTFEDYKIPSYDGDICEEINDNTPKFTKTEINTAKNSSYEKYSKLDSLGRCGVAIASLNYDLMPTYKRGSISAIYPTGWVQQQYDCVSGKYLYNRCHLIGFQLTGVDNVHEKKNVCRQNLITGTRYFNTPGMLDYENEVAEYLRSKQSNHVLYSVTPIFKGDNLVASGVLIEAKSLEDKSINFCIFCYNVQPGVAIDYSNGNSKLASSVVFSAPKWKSVSARKGSLKLSWKRVSAVQGYQIAYKVSGAKKFTTTQTNKLTKSISKLKRGKTYQVKVRAYSKLSGKMQYGKWSIVKKIKTK